MTIRAEIRERMASLGITQSELSRRAGIDRKAVNRYLNGRTSNANLDAMLRALQLNRLTWDK